MTRRSIIEYAEALRDRYFRALKEEKGRMLDGLQRLLVCMAKRPSGCCIGGAGKDQANGVVGNVNMVQKWQRH